MLGRQGNAGEGQSRGTGFEFAVSLAVFVGEKAALQPESLLVKGKAGSDVVHIQNHITK